MGQEKKDLRPRFEIYDGGRGCDLGIHEVVVHLCAPTDQLILIMPNELLGKVMWRIAGKLYASETMGAINNFAEQRFGLSDPNDFPILKKILYEFEGVTTVRKGDGPWKPSDLEKNHLQKLFLLSTRPDDSKRAEKERFAMAMRDIIVNIRKQCQGDWYLGTRFPRDWAERLAYIKSMKKCRVVLAGSLIESKENGINGLAYVAEAKNLDNGSAFIDYVENIMNAEPLHYLSEDKIGLREISLESEHQSVSDEKFTAMDLKFEGPDNYGAKLIIAIKEI